MPSGLNFNYLVKSVTKYFGISHPAYRSNFNLAQDINFKVITARKLRRPYTAAHTDEYPIYDRDTLQFPTERRRSYEGAARRPNWAQEEQYTGDTSNILMQPLRPRCNGDSHMQHTAGTNVSSGSYTQHMEHCKVVPTPLGAQQDEPILNKLISVVPEQARPIGIGAPHMLRKGAQHSRSSFIGTDHISQHITEIPIHKRQRSDANNYRHTRPKKTGISTVPTHRGSRGLVYEGGAMSGGNSGAEYTQMRNWYHAGG